MINRLAAPFEDTINFVPAGENFKGLANLKPSTIISSLITLVLVVAGIAFFFMLVIGGVRWIIAGGDKGQTEAARSQITAALVGLVIVFSAWAIIQIIGAVFGVNLLDINLKLLGPGQ